MKKPVDIVVWSGGLDSTLVLDQLCSSNPSKCIWAFSIDWDVLDNLKTKKEKEVRKNYLRYAKKKGYDIVHRTICVKANMGTKHLGHAQALAWASYVTPYLPKNSNLYLGYHTGDEFWECASWFGKYVEYASKIGERKITLKYPLKYMSKYRILEEIKSRRIPASCVWTCEQPRKRRGKIVSCGKCTPCINLRTAKYEYNLRKRVL